MASRPEARPGCLEEVARAAQGEVLAVLGAFHPTPDDELPADCGTLVLLGPEEPGFWAAFRAGAEYRDGGADPIDRRSARVIGGLADRLGAAALFPFGGPPHRPFLRWAIRSGHAWSSPVGLLVHETAGLMVSFRGALAFAQRFDLPQPGPRPCDTCAGFCLDACPVGALGKGGYDLRACHGFLDTAAGEDCLGRGCAVRRACPVGAGRRVEAQSAFHMKAFHGRH